MSGVPDELWASLKSGQPEDRVRAARQLVEFAEPADLDRIRLTRARETDALTTQLLQRVEERLADNRATKPVEAQTATEIARQATRGLAGLFLHELAPLVGMLEFELASVVTNYDESGSRALVLRIRRFMETVRRLQEASADPDATELDLTQLVGEIIGEVIDESSSKIGAETMSRISVDVARDDPVLVRADPEFIRLALTNGLRNAFESCVGIDSLPLPAVVVSWGVTDRDAWITVIDEGRGLPLGAGDLFAPAQSTKAPTTNSGMGLSIARAAMVGLFGTVQLQPRESRGARYELRWPGTAS